MRETGRRDFCIACRRETEYILRKKNIIKTIRDKHFALLDCSFHNVGEICNLKKVPMRIVKKGKSRY